MKGWRWGGAKGRSSEGSTKPPTSSRPLITSGGTARATKDFVDSSREEEEEAKEGEQ